MSKLSQGRFLGQHYLPAAHSKLPPRSADHVLTGGIAIIVVPVPAVLAVLLRDLDTVQPERSACVAKLVEIQQRSQRDEAVLLRWWATFAL